jgi:zinc protease
MEKYRNGLSPEDLLFTKNYLLRANARSFETLGNLIGVLGSISAYNKPHDFVKKEESFIRNLTFESHRKLAEKYIVPDKMIYVVVGDAATQLEPLKEIGFGDPVLIKP